MANKYSYNKTVLPALPNTGSYSNHYIVYNVYGDHGYRLYETDIAAYCSSEGEVTFPSGTKAVIWNASAEDDEWRDRTDFVVGDTVLSNEVILIWTHYDIFYEDGTTVYKYGTEPVLISEDSVAPDTSKWKAMRALVRGILAGLLSYGYMGECEGEVAQ